MAKFELIEEQQKVLENDKKNMLISASAGSGKTFIMIKYISDLICKKRVPVKDLLVLTFTKAAAREMKERLEKNLKEEIEDAFIIDQIDQLSIANISTIHSFCEKSLKKYANLLEIPENFSVLDENLSQKIRYKAFEGALKEFEKDFSEEYLELMSLYKNNKNKVRDIVFDVEKIVNSVADKSEFLKKTTSLSEVYFDKALKFLFEKSKKFFEGCLIQIENTKLEDFYQIVKPAYESLLNCRDLFELCAVEFVFPKMPLRKVVGNELVDVLNEIKKATNKMLESIKSLNLSDKESVDYQKFGKIEKIIIKLFEIYEKNENLIKKAQNGLDFYDLEKYMNVLSQKENLFSDIKYVFVDEYQDTNKVQERIVKNIAQNCNFVAVGDLKQGIYGFRLASSEIFLKDLEDFERDEFSTVNYLKSNFRSSKKVLNFVNDVFKVCMTKDFAKIDYEKTSMLDGQSKFVDDGQKAINIDVVCEESNKKNSFSNIYSVKEAECNVENRKEKTLLDIKRRINEVLSSQISVDGQLRKCKYSDIAILSRNRNGVFNQLEDYLQQCGIPLVSNSRNSLMDEVEIKVLVNYLKLVLCFDDEIALLSVLTSGLGGYSIDEIVSEKGDCESLCEMVLQDKNLKFLEFNKNLSDFALDLQIFGIKTAFLKLFAKTKYRAFINSKSNFQKVNLFVDKFLEEIVSSGYEFDLPRLINYFETVDIIVTPEVAEVDDAVLLTTIHNSKGLEYPIVFLIGCDQSLKKSASKSDVEVNEEFGFAVKYFDKENNNEVLTAKMLAIKEIEKEKDFIEELMIFYVALTRAKNRLYLFGEKPKSEKLRLVDCDSYFDLIFFALKYQSKLFKEKGFYQDDNMQICLIEEISEENFSIEQDFDVAEVDQDLKKKVEEYISFKYRFDEKTNYRLKESVTSLTQKEDPQVFVGSGKEEMFLQTGNAYHLALKLLDFEKVKSLSDLQDWLKENWCQDFELIDAELLLKNVLLLKEITKGSDKVFKEKEFLMKEKVSNLLEEDVSDEILVQGIVDLFVIKNGQICLVDYKFSNAGKEYLIRKYFNQLKLYKIALENALKMPVKNVFLLSLKENNLIKIDIQ